MLNRELIEKKLRRIEELLRELSLVDDFNKFNKEIRAFLLKS